MSKKKLSEKEIEALYRKGMKAYRARCYQNALSWLRLAADHGHPDAQKAVGDIYSRGDGVKEDLGKALDWYRKAFYNGNGEAGRLEEQICHMLELMI